MTFPSSTATIVIIRGRWWDAVTQTGVDGSVTSLPLLAGGGTTRTPNLADLTAYSHIKTRQRVASPHPDTGYYAFPAVANNDPDLDSYGGLRVTFEGEEPFLVEVDANAPQVTADQEMVDALAALDVPYIVQPSDTVRAQWLVEAAVLTTPAPQPPVAYWTSGQTASAIATAVGGVGGIVTEQIQDTAAGLLTGGTHTGISFAYDDPAAKVNAIVTVTGDLPEDTGGGGTNGAYIANRTSTNLLSKTTRYVNTSDLIQPAPPAVPGALFAVGRETGAAGLTLTGTTQGGVVDKFGSGSETSLPVALAGEVLTLHCTTAGRWRVVSGFKPQSALDARYLDPVTGLLLGSRKAQQRKLHGFYVALGGRFTSPCDIVMLGDSIMEGTGATAPDARWINRFADAMRVRFPVGDVPGGRGYTPARYIATTLTGQAFTLSGATQVVTDRGLGRRAIGLNPDAGSGAGSMTITRFCTSLTVLYYAAATGNRAQVSIDGQAATLLPAVSAEGTYSSGPLPAGNHTITLSWQAGAGTVIEGAYFANGDETKGIRVWDGAQHGTTADQFNATDGGNATWANALPSTGADLAVIGWMTNDFTTKTPAAYQASLGNVLTLVRSVMPNLPVLFLAPYQRYASGLGGAQWADYVTAMKTVAAADPYAAFYDLGDRIPNIGATDTYGFRSDSTHPNDKGYALIADAVASFLAAGAA